MWFDTWSDITRILAVGAAAYVALVLVLRVTGKRTLAKLNAFDLIVSVALGSILATVLLDTNVTWAEGLTAFALLTVLQLLITWTTTRAPRSRTVITSNATLLLRDGQPFEHPARPEGHDERAAPGGAGLRQRRPRRHRRCRAGERRVPHRHPCGEDGRRYRARRRGDSPPRVKGPVEEGRIRGSVDPPRACHPGMPH